MRGKSGLILFLCILLLLPNTGVAASKELGTYQIHLVDSKDTSQKITGATFNLWKNGEVIQRDLVTGSKGTIFFILEFGDYQLEQTGSVENYKIMDERISFSVTKNKDEGIYISNEVEQEVIQEDSYASGETFKVVDNIEDKYLAYLRLENGVNSKSGKFYVFTEEYAQGSGVKSSLDVYESENLIGVFETDEAGVLDTRTNQKFADAIVQEYDGDPTKCVNGKIPRPSGRLQGSSPYAYPISFVFQEEGKKLSEVYTMYVEDPELDDYILIVTYPDRLYTHGITLKTEEGARIYLTDSEDNRIPIGTYEQVYGSEKPDNIHEYKEVLGTGEDQTIYFFEDRNVGERIDIHVYNDLEQYQNTIIYIKDKF